MLGTGSATVSHIYNTCFVLSTATISDIHHLFVTHAHTDHVFGVIWVIRMVAQCKGYEGHLHVYGNDKVMKVVRTIIDMILAKKQLSKVGERVVFHELADGENFDAGDIRLTCFDIHSTKEKQYGFRAQLPDSTVVACLGDEPYNPLNRPYIEHADWMMCEAFCLYADRDTFKPYEKCHSTALDAGRLAAELGVKNSYCIIPRRRHSLQARKATPRRLPRTSKARLLYLTIWRR